MMRNKRSARVVKTFLKIAIPLVLIGCVACAFMGIQPFVGIKDMLVARVAPYVQSPISTKVTVEERMGRDGYAYYLVVTIVPTSTAQLDKQYMVEFSSPYLSEVITWDTMWTNNPELRAPEARGFVERVRTVVLKQSDELYEHIAQLELRKLQQQLSGWTMRDIEADYQRELYKLINIKVGR